MHSPRERLIRQGVTALADAELLALLIGVGGRRRSALSMAAKILDRAGGFWSLARMSIAELEAFEGIGFATATRLLAAFEAGARAQRAPDPEAPLTSSAAVFERYGAALASCRLERFWVVAVDAKNRPLCAREVAKGGRVRCQVDPAAVLRVPVVESASGAIFVHNHPSGDPTPSADDLGLTERLVAGGRLLQIRILDHLIVGSEGYVSLRDEGLWPISEANS